MRMPFMHPGACAFDALPALHALRMHSGDVLCTACRFSAEEPEAEAAKEIAGAPTAAAASSSGSGAAAPEAAAAATEPKKEK